MFRLPQVAQAVVVTVWVLVQPWLRWPALSADDSHRLTLAMCSVLLGLIACATPRKALPVSWVWTVLALVAIMSWHHLFMLKDGSYFEHFLEAAWFSDGLIFVLALTWGAWALRQMPPTWWRWIRVAGAGFVLVNLAFALQQAHLNYWRLPMPCVGLMGMDRFLGATGVGWFPILAAWSPWLGTAAIFLILLSGKFMAWVGLTVAWMVWRPPKHWWQRVGLVGMLLTSAWWLSTGNLAWQVKQRLMTWLHTGQTSFEHPWLGAGFSPLSEHAIATHGYTLPSIHSDWLSLAFHAGWPLCGVVLWVIWRLLTSANVSPVGRALRASLVGVLVMSMGQSLLGHARILGVLVVWGIWFLQEHEEARIAHG